MRDKINQINKRLQQDPRFQEQMQKLKPQRSIWGFLGVVLFFFVPEFLNVFYSKEINEWIANYANNAPNEKMAHTLIWLSQKVFDGEISYLNIAIGILFLIWLFKK